MSIERIIDANVKRRYYMKQRMRVMGALGAYLRTVNGWVWKEHETAAERKERKRIEALVAEMISTGDAGNDNDSEMVQSTKVACAPFIKKEEEFLSTMASLAKELPVWKSFVEPTRGFGLTGLAMIVGEAGDLSNYSKDSKLWKRMGLAVLDEKRQGNPGKGASADDWTRHGYNRERRSAMWQVGDALVKQNGLGEGDHKYRMIYESRREYECIEHPEWRKGITEKTNKKTGEVKTKPAYAMQCHRRAQRYMEKRLLRDLWKAWRWASSRVAEKPIVAVPVALNSAETIGSEPTTAIAALSPRRRASGEMAEKPSGDTPVALNSAETSAAPPATASFEVSPPKRRATVLLAAKPDGGTPVAPISAETTGGSLGTARVSMSPPKRLAKMSMAGKPKTIVPVASISAETNIHASETTAP